MPNKLRLYALFRPLILVVGLLGVLPRPAWAVQGQSEFLIPHPVCNQKTAECFSRVVHHFQAHFARLSHSEPSRTVSNYSFIGDQGGRTNFVFVTLPGLWEDGKQFREMNEHFYKQGATILSVVMPGHGADQNRKPTVSFHSWQEQARRAIETAQILGDKVIVFGHSMGGLAAVDAFIHQPEKIAGLVLLEPALRVRRALGFGVCTIGSAVDRATTRQAANMLAGVEIYGERNTPNLTMGCETVGFGINFITNLARMTSGKGELFETPVYLFTNQNDDVVQGNASREIILRSFKSVDEGHYMDGKKLHHGGAASEYVMSMNAAGGLHGIENYLLKVGFEPAVAPYYDRAWRDHLRQGIDSFQWRLWRHFDRNADLVYKSEKSSAELFLELASLLDGVSRYYEANGSYTTTPADEPPRDPFTRAARFYYDFFNDFGAQYKWLDKAFLALSAEPEFFIKNYQAAFTFCSENGRRGEPGFNVMCDPDPEHLNFSQEQYALIEKTLRYVCDTSLLGNAKSRFYY